jgi:hypothetical protein
MSSIEKIVRPFQTGDVFRARRLPPSQLLITAPELVSVDWEGRADSSYAEEDPNLQINFKVEWEEDRMDIGAEHCDDSFRCELSASHSARGPVKRHRG